MAVGVIDEFWVKPAGILASKRYARVVVNYDTGDLQEFDVPGKPSINLNCISDYPKEGRRYNPGDKITEWCNIVTHTKFTVYAQDCKPFAYANAALNQAECGYLAPIPAPYVPQNPFGNASYGLYRFYEDCTEDGADTMRTEIYKKNFAGVATEIPQAADNAIILNYPDVREKFEPFRPCELIMRFISQVDFEFQEFSSFDEREFLVKHFESGELKFAGYLNNDNSSEPFVAAPYAAELRATDGIGGLQNITYPMPNGGLVDTKQTFISILCYALAKTNLDLDLHTICNLYERKMANGLDDDPLNQSDVNPFRMTEGGTIDTCYEVLRKVLTAFGAYLVQEDGAWKFVCVDELSQLVIRKRVYNYTGFFLRGENVVPTRIAGANEEVLLINNATVIRKIDAYKRVVVNLKYGQSPALLYNGDFEQWDGQNFLYWPNYGNINISRVQRFIPGTGGAQIPLDNYALQFNEKAVSTKWVQANPVQVYKGDKVRFSFRFYCDTTKIYPLFKFRFNIGSWYLYLQAGTGESTPVWVQQIATTDLYFLIQAFPTSANFYKFEFELPEMPESGLLNILAFGGDDVRNFTTGAGSEVVYPYSPLQIDDVKISKQADEPEGYTYSSAQLGFYTEAPETIDIAFGDKVDELTFIQQGGQIGAQVAANDLYKIRTVDGTLSTEWYKYGTLNNYAPLGQMLARTILKQYQAPFMVVTGDFMGTNLRYTDVFSILLNGNTGFSQKQFMVMGATFDRKRKTMQAIWYEIFGKDIKTIDVSQPEQLGQSPPEIIQNPTQPPVPDGDGIFTGQFTEQFT